MALRKIKGGKESIYPSLRQENVNQKSTPKFEVSERSCANNFWVKNIQKHVTYTFIYILNICYQHYYRIVSSKYQPQSVSLFWAAGKYFKLRLSTLLQIASTKYFYIEIPSDFIQNSYAFSLLLTIYVQKCYIDD